jgi:hypothetical protein
MKIVLNKIAKVAGSPPRRTQQKVALFNNYYEKAKEGKALIIEKRGVDLYVKDFTSYTVKKAKK